MANFSRITDRLYLGGTPSVQDVAELLDLGVFFILNCQIEHDDAPTLTGIYPSVSYCWDGTPDWTPKAAFGLQPKPVEWFQKGLDFWMPQLGKPGSKIYVHCHAGANRSATMVWAILRAWGASAEEADAVIDSQRLVAVFGLFADHPWRVDADKALKELGWT